MRKSVFKLGRKPMFGTNNLLQCDQPYHIGCLSPPLSAVPEGEWFCPECALEADAGPDEPFKPALGITIPKPANGKKGVKQDVVETAGSAKALASATNGASTPSKFVKGGKRSREEERSAQGEMFPPINIYNCRLSIL